MKPQKDNKEISVYKEHYLLDNVFIKDTDLQYIFKKTEKIITAIYLITNFLVREEPLKWSLRKSASGLLKTLMTFSQSSLSDREKTSHDLNVGILELNSLFDLAYHSGFVSQMNYEILSYEISKLTASIAEYNQESISSNKSLFSDEYFYVHKNQKDTDAYKGQNDFTTNNVFYNNVKDTDQSNRNGSGIRQNQNIKDSDAVNLPNNNYNNFNSLNHSLNRTSSNGRKSLKTQNKKLGRPKDKKTNEERRTRIVAEVKRQEKVSVKDIAKVINDCSEKTLQRELLAMVDDGILIKEGERRWSRYSLKK